MTILFSILMQAAAPRWVGDWFSFMQNMGLAMPIACGSVFLVALIGLIALLIRHLLVVKMTEMDGTFLGTLRGSPHVLSIYQDEQRFAGSSRWPVYFAGCREIAYYLIGTDQVDKNFAMRLRAAGRITPSQMAAVLRAMQHAAGQLTLDLQMMLPRALAAGAALPWVGLLGAAAVLIEAGCNPESAGWTAAQLVLPALVPVVFSILLCLAIIPAARAQTRRVRNDIVRLDLFVLELSLTLERVFVDHRQQMDDLPSVASLGLPDSPSFSLPPSDTLTRLAAP